MTLYFADRSMNILGMASTELPDSLRIYDDEKTEEIDAGVVTLEFKVYYTPLNRSTVSSYVAAGNYILYNDGDVEGFFTIIDYEEDVLNRSIKIYAEDNGMDLLNETLNSYESTTAQTAAFYINKFAYDSGFTINVNEVSSKTLALSWSSSQTASERILSVATEFEAELSYSFVIENMSIKHKYINLYSQRGSDNGVQLRFGKEIDNITVTKSVADLATGLDVTGGTPDGAESAITLNGYKYDDGDFYVTGTKLLSRKALSKWSRYLYESGSDQGHIIDRWSYDTTDQKTLFTKALAHLKEVCDTNVECEVDLLTFPTNISLGDTVYIIDDAGELYMSARLLKLVTSRANKTYTATFGDYVQQDSGISSKVQSLANQFAQLAAKRTLYTWVAYADDGKGTNISKSSNGKKYMGIASNRVNKTVDISDASVYTWSKIAGDDGKSITDITEYYQINNSSTTAPTSWSEEVVAPTTSSPYLWNYEIYTYSDGSKAETKKRIIGVYGQTGTSIGSVVNYYLSTDKSEGVTTGTSGWTQTIQAMDPVNRYLWNYEIVKDTNGNKISSTVPHIIGVYGEPGKGVKSISNYYLATDKASGVTKDTKGWTDYVQTITEDIKYLWNYEQVAYSDETTSSTTPCVIGVYGASGKGISSITEYYASSSSCTVEPTQWKTEMPELTSVFKYLWNYETIVYTDKTTKDSNKRIIGVYGDTGLVALQPNRNWENTYITVGGTITVTTSDFNRTPVVGDTFTNIDKSSNTGTWKVTAVSGTDVTARLMSYVNSKGEAGKSPTVSVVKTEGVTTITAKNADGTTTTETVNDGVSFVWNLLSGTASGEGWIYGGFTPETHTFSRTNSTTTKNSISYTGVALEENTVYTLSADVWTNGFVSTAEASCSDFAGTEIISHTIPIESTNVTHMAWSFSTKPDIDYSQAIIEFSNNGSTTEGTDAVLYVRNIKMEKGTTASAWCTTQEETNGKGIKTKEDTYALSSSQTTPPDTTWSTDIPIITGELEYLWTRSVITYTDKTTSTTYSVSSIWNLDQVKNKFDDIGDSINDLSLKIEDQSTSIASIQSQSDQIQLTYTTVTNTLEKVGTDVRDIQTNLDNWINFDKDGKLTIGASTVTGFVNYALQLSKEKISFLQDNNEVAYITGKEMYIMNSTVVQEMNVGNFTWESRENGNMALVYRD